LVISGVIYVTSFLVMLMTFSYTSLQELTSPLYAIARLIKYGPFYQRLDTIFLFLWCMASFITVSVLFYSAVSVYCKIFKLQDARPVVVPMSILLFAAAMAPRDFSNIVYTSVQQLRESGWIVFYGLPLIALIIAMIRRKKGVVSNA
ncbi:MAG TPA: GerAB/ArcD/ProY family transporter, partial [Clostridia bacterium]